MYDVHCTYRRMVASFLIRGLSCFAGVQSLRDRRLAAEIPYTSTVDVQASRRRARNIDRISRRTFPLAFVVFNIIYWIAYTVPSPGTGDMSDELWNTITVRDRASSGAVDFGWGKVNLSKIWNGYYSIAKIYRSSSDTLTGSFARYKFVTYLLTYKRQSYAYVK